MRERIPLLVGLTVLALAVVIGSALIASGIRDRNRTDVITADRLGLRRLALEPLERSVDSR
jgi:hypothetical protein